MKGELEIIACESLYVESKGKNSGKRKEEKNNEKREREKPEEDARCRQVNR